MRALLVALGGGTLAVALTAQVWSGAWAAESAAVPAVTPTGVVTVVIPGTTSSSPSPSHSGGGGSTGGSGGSGGSGGGTQSPAPTPEPTAAPQPPANPGASASGLKLDHERIAVQEWMIAIGTGFKAGEMVQLVLYSDPIVVGSFKADASGRFEARFKIPKDFRLGTHTAEATGWSSAHVANKQFTVVSDPHPAGTIPFLWWLIIVLGVLVTGVIVTAVYFRRTVAGWFSGAPLQPSETPT